MTRRRQTGSPPARASTRGRRAAPHALFEPREIEKLVALMRESGLLELEIESGGEKVRLVREAHGTAVGQPSQPRPSGAATVVGFAGGAPAQETDGATTSQEAAAGSAGGERTITSPMVGTFHRAAEPGNPPFAEVGDVVERGQVICLIEAMKMMNEIEAECRSRLTQVLVEDGQPVEYGEALFLIEPL